MEVAVFYLNYRAVTGITASRSLDLVVEPVIEPRVDFPYELNRVGVLAAGILDGFARVTSRAILR
jgi:hypothetical protein